MSSLVRLLLRSQATWVTKTGTFGYLPVRCLSSVPAGAERERLIKGNTEKNMQDIEQTAADISKDFKGRSVRWVEANEVYYGKERDMKNFPPMKRAPYMPKVRFFYASDEWFQRFYKTTGVTGPYLFLGGFTTFCLSKELIVFDPATATAVYFGFAMVMAHRYFGDKIQKWYSGELDKISDRDYYAPLKAIKKECAAVIKNADDGLDRIKMFPEVFKAKREIIDFQLELEYRQRLMETHNAVEKQLKYHLEVDDAKQRFKQHHMVDWIMSNVLKSLTPQYEKDTLAQCIKDLRAVAPKPA